MAAGGDFYRPFTPVFNAGLQRFVAGGADFDDVGQGIAHRELEAPLGVGLLRDGRFAGEELSAGDRLVSLLVDDTATNAVLG